MDIQEKELKMFIQAREEQDSSSDDEESTQPRIFKAKLKTQDQIDQQKMISES